LKFVISTQYLENYNCDNPGEGDDYFKFKGGSDYVVSGFDRIQDATVFVLDTKCFNNDMCKEFPASWHTYDEWLANLPEDPEYREFLIDSARTVDRQVA